jgi:hypothetical protein
MSRILKSSVLAVSGAKYSAPLNQQQKNNTYGDDRSVVKTGENNVSPLLQHINSLIAPATNINRPSLLPSSANGSTTNATLVNTSGKSSAPGSSTSTNASNSAGSALPTAELVGVVPPIENSTTASSSSAAAPDAVATREHTTLEPMRYWKQPAAFGNDDLVTIHVCDENQQINRDFCCKRDITHMKYFEKFLSQNDNGYDDIDISVHCDAEIFEWLMTYIHAPDKDIEIDKSIIVSILISSEFLQIDSLVELCIQQVSKHINEIIKLPIDLSCISEKLINRIAFITPPKVRQTAIK